MSTFLRGTGARVKSAVTSTKKKMAQAKQELTGRVREVGWQAKGRFVGFQKELRTTESKEERAKLRAAALTRSKVAIRNILVSAHTRGMPGDGGGEAVVPVRAYYRGGGRLDAVDHMREPPSYLIPIEKRDFELPPRIDQLAYPILEDTLTAATIIYTDRKGNLEWMSPTEFLKRIPSDSDFGYKLSAYDAYIKGAITDGEKRRLSKAIQDINEKVPQDIVELDYRNQHGDWPQFDNKWAAMAALKLGIKKIPVGVLKDDRTVPESKLYVPEGAFDEEPTDDTTQS